MGAAAQFEDGQFLSLQDRAEAQGPVELGRVADIGDAERDMADGDRGRHLLFGHFFKPGSSLIWHQVLTRQRLPRIRVALHTAQPSLSPFSYASYQGSISRLR